jgi:hypothetical protein
MQQRLKSTAGSARARIIATEFLNEFFATAHDAITALDVGFGREAVSTFATDLESNWLRGVLF